MTAAGVPRALREGRGRVAAFAYPEAAARALGRAAERAEWLRRPHGTVPVRRGIDRTAAEGVIQAALSRGDDVWLEAAETRSSCSRMAFRLSQSGSSPPPTTLSQRARELGFPVVVKTALAGAHKTDVDGLALDLADEEAVRSGRLGSARPVLVQPMVAGSAELLAGIVQDPVFGPLVAFGPGGVLAELIGEAGFRIAPLTDQDAEELVLGGKAGSSSAGSVASRPGTRIAHRSRSAPRASRRRPPRRRRTRPESRHRPARRLRCRRRPRARASAGRVSRAKTW